MSNQNASDTGPLFEMIGAVSPVLVAFTKSNVVDELWGRPGLSPRDRSLVTLAALITRNAAIAYPHYVHKALDSGLTGAEISELVTHLAFYASWPNAFAAIVTLKDIFAQRGIDASQLPEVAPDLLPVADALPAENERAAFVASAVAPASQALQHFTDDLLHHQVWRRPGLAPRDRGLATIVSLVALGQSAFLPFFMNRAVLKGVTREEIGEALAHVAFYAGWGNAIQAAGVVTQFFDSRQA